MREYDSGFGRFLPCCRVNRRKLWEVATMSTWS